MARGGDRQGATSFPRTIAAGAIALVIALAGCGGSTQPSVHPLATLDLSTVSFPPSPSPTPVPPGQLAARAFLAFAGTSRPTFHIAFKGVVLAVISKVTIRGTVDAAGLDVATSTHYVFDSGAKGTIETRWVKRVAYERLVPGAWRRRPAFDAKQVVDPFGSLTEPGAVKYDSTKKMNGKTVYVLAVDGGRLLDLTTIPAYNLTDEGVTSATWMLVVDADGHPISGTWKLRGKGRVSGQLQELIVDLDVTFSKVGAKITISPP